MNHQRPINLDLGSFKYPAMSIASILHRISGVILFVLLPLILYILQLSLKSQSSYDELQTFLIHPHIRFCLWVFFSALIYHVIAGVRHIMLDMGIGEELHAARRSAVIVIVLAAVMVLFLGMWIW
ncbi:MAG: succinate dehydrogenase, cytochrome b556 subunit [Legionellaceae bacterium]|nr:succinate dehydrogenase, cytochrome b556 subunit [Legionellaceae bacterium]